MSKSRILPFAVFFFLLAMTAFASPHADQKSAAYPTESSLLAMARWLSTNFDLPYSDEPPRVEFTTPAQLSKLRYKGLLSHQREVIGGEHATPLPEFQREVVAVYDDSTRTIYLPEHWTGASLAEQSVLVHEMVHHLQNRAGLKYACSGAREKPAYLAQRKWLENHELELENEFQVDMFTIVALAACMS